ncbi:2-oxoglutarate (2OG) and Fe(II)-dependent oxygenase superfamily protein [Rhynchospora pubera]|uniref:2-oxoglutarate (2OG) and Fe(II)-dependent oxygenase superfamily protein n=1 Tax=Rhynchospora pubera TaxID=906938 RepID=A0AAV8H2L8_9POAL|nr:2-oxoglutarate (2OG) and Fe(II)-dependent oxygenase superfamily protein [Rhynchospora pubera]
METTEANERPKILGGCMKTRNVQALAADHNMLMADILERYIRPEMAVDDVLVENGSEEIPVIDMSRLMDEVSWEEEASKLKFACENWGFFQLVNHGVPEKVIEELKEDIMGFHDLPLEKREEVAQLPGDLEGYGQAFIASEEQKLDWADMLYLFTQPPHFRNYKHWPSQPPSFRDSLENYSNATQKVAHCILGFMATILGIKHETISEIHESQSVRINYYPPCANGHDKMIGLSPHSDGCGLTLLLQVNPVSGLQIRRNGKWLPIMPLPGALIVNIGDALEILTNGRYKSIEHRAVINAKEERISIAALHAPGFEKTVGPLAEIVGEGTPLFKSVTMLEYAKLFFSQKQLYGKKMVELLKLNP